ncbi:DUF3108 domain-containing protein [Paraferrimonas sedimenticola]|uniref:DUF3108 domain-containing protein n=1 Tax=Paraferrimonas sedimenticola TaxID=375674 RepID=A0AA37RVR6_9GAMM|nr:DUF3108 domain-containing protein [Paraferrimonas sedimenticola]GLP96186.1 hypothetical protein GCM10007895_14920 [Paraferrimonas sedimenticola]
MKSWWIPAIALAALPALAQPLTPHEAEYKVYYGNIELGGARYQLNQVDPTHFQYRFDSSLSLLVLSDKRQITSEFELEGDQLYPIRFMHDRKGTGSDFTEQTAYLKDRGVIHSRYKGERAKIDYDKRLFDPLMVQLQLRMDLHNAEEIGEYYYEMVKDNEVDDYGFRSAGTETITVNDKQYDTVKLVVIRDSDKRETFIWFAPELDFMPVQLAHFEKGSKQLNIRLHSYHPYETSKPATAQAAP